MASPQRSNRLQRFELGRQARTIISRRQHGEFESGKRGHEPLDTLLRAAEGRVPKLLPVKYARMSASPFAFFRGAVSIMAADLASQPHTGLTVQLCGDAHLQNMGCFAGPDGRLIFDINDFDETTPGPWEWDVKRMAASIVLAGLESEHGRHACWKAAATFAQSYCSAMAEFAEEPILMAARFQIHRLDDVAAVSDAMSQAQRARPLELLEKYTERKQKGGRRFKRIPLQMWPVVGQEKRDVLETLPAYRKSLAADREHLFDFFKPSDVGFKVVGTGSVGLRDYVVLMQGNGAKDPLFLQIKQEVKSAYAPYLKGRPFDHEGQRVADGQRRIQALSDLLLGWTSIGGCNYLVRQMNDHKGSVDLTKLKGKGLNDLGVIAGELLARGHARSGDSVAIHGYLGDGDRMVRATARFAEGYAELAQEDFVQFKKAIEDGRVPVAH